MNQKQDYKEAYERGKLHVRYLLIIACILAVISISIALGGNDSALGQISMASTVSSIILSAIAIFMSISGEDKLNYTHNKLLETSDRMSDITANIEKANNSLNSTINEKFLKMDDIFDRLERIGQSVDNMEKEVLNKTLYINEGSSVKISNDTIWNVYYNMVSKVKEDSIIMDATKEEIAYVVICCSERGKLDYDNMEKYVKSVIADVDAFSLGSAFGVVCVFISLGITKIETAQYFKEKMGITEAKKDVITKFL